MTGLSYMYYMYFPATALTNSLREEDRGTNLWKVRDGNVEDEPLVPARVGGPRNLIGALLGYKELPPVVDTRVNVHHVHIRVTKVVQSHYSNPNGKEGWRASQ